MKEHSMALGTGSPAKAWLRALEQTASIARNRERILPVAMQSLAEQFGDAPALLSDEERLTYRALAERANRYARWALDRGLAKGEVVCLLMPNRPEYIAIWFGITSVGGVVALLNTNLSGPSLAHCIEIVAPRHIIVDARLTTSLATALPALTSAPNVWEHGVGDGPFPRIDVDRYAGEILSSAERRLATVDDRALYIYTSGTTGLPKAASASHGRLMQWAYWFAGMMNTQSADRIYNCLPMYHSVGGVQAPGAVLVAGGSVVIREKFSVRHFWSDIVGWDCTLFQYIGELCRYLLQGEPSPHEAAHRIRLACGNGLSLDVWGRFTHRFRIPRILEFYAATEGNVSWFNIEGEPGSVGRVPPYLAHRFLTALIKFDFDKEEPVRNDLGFCVPCALNEVGEAIGRIQDQPSNFAGGFEGYASRDASDGKILRNVFEPGDAWFRTGDLIRKDERGFLYFIDRIGDTFRWKGENVSTSEVAQVICEFPGVNQASVYGVTVPGADGRAGMAALVTGLELDLKAFQAHLIARLPHYARPLFLRIAPQMEMTSTLKFTKTGLVRNGYNPAATEAGIYFNHPEHDGFVRLDEAVYNRIQTGKFRWQGPTGPEGEATNTERKSGTHGS